MKFDYVISLGYNCANASSAAKNGFRSFSGPFDWCTIPYESLIHFLESDFEDFLDYKNLKIMSGEDKCFNDVKYNLCFPHEIKTSLEDDFCRIKEKYLRRINNFNCILDMKICFVRMIYNQHEVDRIVSDNNFLRTILINYNSDNELIYVISKKLNIPDNFPQKYYLFEENTNYDSLRNRLRYAYDSVINNSLVIYLSENYNPDKRMRNLYFDQQNEMKRLNWINMMKSLIDKADFHNKNIKNTIAIYGAADIGVHFYNAIKDIYNVSCYIDKFLDRNNM